MGLRKPILTSPLAPRPATKAKQHTRNVSPQQKAYSHEISSTTNLQSSDLVTSHATRTLVVLSFVQTEPLSCKEGNQTTDASEEEDNDDATKEYFYEDGTVEENLDDGASSLDQVKSMVDTSKTLDNVGTGCNNNALNNLLKGIQLEEETMDINGFQVLTSQVQSVNHIFKRHPDTALSFRLKNQQIRKTYMDALLRLIETLCQPPEKLSEDDLSNADETLVDLINVGFKLDWLKTKLNEVSEKKMEQTSVARLLTMEEQLQKLKHMVLDYESQLHKEKEKVLAVRAPLTFKDVVC